MRSRTQLAVALARVEMALPALVQHLAREAVARHLPSRAQPLRMAVVAAEALMELGQERPQSCRFLPDQAVLAVAVAVRR